MNDYMMNYTKRIKWFLIISGLFLTYSFAGFFFTLFMDGNITWNDDVIFVGYFAYLAIFTGYNWYKFYQDSIQQEAKQKETYQNPEFLKWAEEVEFPKFDHKAGRKQVGRMSLLVIIFNIIMITCKLLFVSF